MEGDSEGLRQAATSSSRARSLGSRSKSQGRTGSLGPAELLARRQQLLSSDQASGSWSSSGLTSSQDELTLADGALGTLHRRSQVRRAKQLAVEQQASAGRDDANRMSVEAKLESLSELLKSHQEREEEEEKRKQKLAPLEANANGSSSKSIENVYILLAKKEKDLQLAAELGKVLLEKNDELSKANERITEDYSHKLELLEQDKHKLKRKLDQLDGEYENRLIELQTDCNILKNQLEEQKQLGQKKDKEKSKLIDDLVQQNQRLTSELVEATKSEELLSSQLEQLNERFNVRFLNRQDHVAQLDALKEEIQIVNQRKQDLERRLKSANNDKANLQLLIEESGDKLLLLENLLNEKDANLGDLLEELSELKESSSWLSSELDSMINLNERLVINSSDALESNEKLGVNLEMVQKKRSQLLQQLKEFRLRKQSRFKASEFIISKRRSASVSVPAGKQLGGRRIAGASRRHREGSGKRRDDGSLFDELNGGRGSSFSPTGSSSAPDGEEEEEEDEELPGEKRGKLSGDLISQIHSQLSHFLKLLQARKDAFQNGTSNQHLYSPNSTDDSGISGDDNLVEKTETKGHEVDDPSSWRRLLDSLKSLIEEMPCSTCYLMIAERADYEQLQKRHRKLCEQVKRNEDELLSLSATKLEQETKLAVLEEKCNTLSNDLKNCDKPKEEIVKLAWKARDEAVERKNAAEISLAKTRIENMQISSQLMEVVQQKGELSQKLAQFEDDIHYITQDSVKAKFTWEEYVEKLRRTKEADSNANGGLNPLAQLLNFSSNVVASTPANGKTRTLENTLGNNLKPAMDNLSSQSANLMRNFTSNRFNLKFWQKNSTASSEPKQQNQPVDNDSDHKLATPNKPAAIGDTQLGQELA